jgi:uncharacterized protein (TIGR02466 family)
MNWLKEVVYESVAEIHSAPELSHARPHWPAEVEAEAWGNVYGPGDYQQPHVHHDTAWACVYFVDAPGEVKAGGTLDLYPPHVTQRALPRTAIYSLVPAAGMLVLFPGWVYHSVSPLIGVEPRVSIAINIRML